MKADWRRAYISFVCAVVTRDKMAYKSSRQCEKRLEERVQCRGGVFKSAFTLQPATVEADVPVRQLVDEVKHLGDDRIKAIGCHA